MKTLLGTVLCGITSLGVLAWALRGPMGIAAAVAAPYKPTAACTALRTASATLSASAADVHGSTYPRMVAAVAALETFRRSTECGPTCDREAGALLQEDEPELMSSAMRSLANRKCISADRVEAILQTPLTPPGRLARAVVRALKSRRGTGGVSWSDERYGTRR